ncbi:MAG: hypothetical protein WCY61_02215 [Sphaerochaeta sp.]
MNRRRIFIIATLLILIIPLSVFAQEYVRVVDGELSSLRLFDPNGRAIDLEDFDLDSIQLGTIIVTGDSPLLLETSRGDINLHGDSILILDELTSWDTTLLLIDGAISAKTTSGELSIITPATLYELSSPGEVYVVSTATDERAVSFDVPLKATNLITYKATTIDPNYELELATPRLQTRKLASYEVDRRRIAKPVIEEAPLSVVVVEEEPAIRIPQPPEMVYWTIELGYVEEEPVVEEEVILPVEEEIILPVEEELLLPPPPVALEPVIERTEPAPVVVAPPVVQTGSLRVSQSNTKENKGSYGLEAGYTLTFPLEGDSFWPNHRLEVKPFVTYNSFALRLKAQVETTNFTSFDTNFLDIDTSALGIASYIFGIIDYLKFGYSSSPFYLLIEEGGYPGTQLAPFIAPMFPSGKMAAYNSITIGGLRLNTSFDDLRFTNLLNDQGSQLGSTVLEYTLGGSYPMSIALGTLAFFEPDSSDMNIDLFPLLEFTFPIINTRLTKFSALLLASGYLPVYPEVKVEEFFDLNTTYFFPNHQLGVGLMVDHEPFNAQIMASLAGGKNHLMHFNSIAEAYEGLDHDGLVDLYASGTYKSNKLAISLILNVPFTSDFTIATVTGKSRSADFSQLGFTYSGDVFTFGLGASQVGLIDAIKEVAGGAELLSLFVSPWTSSFVEASYTYKMFTFGARLNLPIDLHGQRPTVDVGVKVRLEGTF